MEAFVFTLIFTVSTILAVLTACVIAYLFREFVDYFGWLRMRKGFSSSCSYLESNIFISLHEKDVMRRMKNIFMAKSDLDREIAQEKKEIKRLEAQNHKITELEELRKRRERLFKHVDERSDF